MAEAQLAHKKKIKIARRKHVSTDLWLSPGLIVMCVVLRVCFSIYCMQ